MNCWREEGAWRPFRRLKPARVNALRFCVAKAKRGNAAALSASQIKLVWSDDSDSEEGFRVECRVGASDKWVVVGGRVPANLPAFTDYG